ncbi:protein C2-DOMAIN ABA-RELATED 5-like isoform X1 [Ananas comosus]|uniref:Protein C2-DOMAIN ABA-RELATED 5-like isoform X1 n=1 Tax=Ananas comosus TaxID=4615 RepID=A0A6P5FHP0_ANACO|nr:protein C2-DOMAIN ABA-RELATED 5-like isoform X1 [Ananas comosus]
MESLLGLIKVRVVRGVNLAYRDARGSDPYVVLRMGNQKLKTSVKKKSVNPVWQEDLTLSISDPSIPIRLEVYDKDTFSKDDDMGDADLDVQPFVQVAKMDLADIPSGTVVRTVRPCKQNCLADESHIVWKNGRLVQDTILRLRNVESGEVQLQLQWVNIPGVAL